MLRHITLLLLTVFAGAALAQQRVDALLSHERLLCIVPMVGTGKADDASNHEYGHRDGGEAQAALLAIPVGRG